MSKPQKEEGGLGFIIFLIIVGIIMAMAMSLGRGQEWQDVYDEAKELTVLVGSFKDTTARSGGSGVVIDDSVVVTCSHNMKNADRIFIYHKEKVYRAEIIDSVAGPDGLAFLKINHLFTKVAKITQPNPFEKVLVVGNTVDKINHVLFNEVMEQRKAEGLNYPVWYLSEGIIRGMSGGGVWNIKGELVGIMWFTIEYQYRHQGLFVDALNVLQRLWLIKLGENQVTP